MDWEPVDESSPRPVQATHALDHAAPDPKQWGKKVARALIWATVLACLVVIVAIFAPNPLAQRRAGMARLAAARTDIAALPVAIDTFYVDAGRFPTAAEGFGALLSPPAGVPAWKGPYIYRQPSDPWGNLYLYRTGTNGGAPAYRIDCTGPDGRPATADDITSGWVAAPMSGK